MMLFTESNPYLRRFIRFCALPYLFLQIDWKICKASKLKVFFDFLYIFFVLKYYPDNYVDCRLWKKHRHEWVYYYGSGFNSYTKARLNKEVQSPKHRVIFNDKYICTQFFKNEVKNPLIYSLIHPNENYHIKIIETFRINKLGKIIIKPLTGNKGIGISIAEKKDNRIKVHTIDNNIPLKDFKINEPCMLQEVIIQHKLLNDFFHGALNTIRVLTMYTKSSDVIIIHALIKFGMGNMFVDNIHLGGIGVGIDVETGRLKKYGYARYRSEYLTHHPDSKKEFNNFKIPYWNEIINMSKRIQSLCPFYRLLGLDIALTDYGPVLTEVNAHRDLAGQEAIVGPILKNKKALIAFSEYNLLINKYQHDLLKE